MITTKYILVFIIILFKPYIVVMIKNLLFGNHGVQRDKGNDVQQLNHCEKNLL